MRRIDVSQSPIHLTIALPVKDGARRLRETLEHIDEFATRFARPCEVIAVDDGSADETREILERFREGHPYLRLISHERNRGKGAALKTAAAEARGELLLAVDADATYSLDGLPPFLERLESGCDAAIGNRRDLHTRFVLHPTEFWYVGARHAMGWAFNRVVRLLLGLHASDTQCGFKCFRTEVAKRRFPEVDAERFDFDVELLGLLELHGHAVAELPVVYLYRDQPTTVRLVRDGARMLRSLLRIGAKLRRLRRAGAVGGGARGDVRGLAGGDGPP